MAVSFIGGENHRPVASHWQTLSHNVVSNAPHHKLGLNSQLPYDHDYDGPSEENWLRSILIVAVGYIFDHVYLKVAQNMEDKNISEQDTVVLNFLLNTHQ